MYKSLSINGRHYLTRRFSNHESRLLSRSHKFAIIVILDLIPPYLLRWYVQSIQGSLCPSPMHLRSLTPRWPLTPGLLRSYVWLCAQGSLWLSPMKIHQSMWIQWPFFPKNWTKGHWPLDDLWPQVCLGHMCDSTQGSLCPNTMKIHQSICGHMQWPFFQKLEPKVIDP